MSSPVTNIACIQVDPARLADFCRTRRIRRLALFGSVLRARLAIGAAQGRARTDLDHDRISRAACERFIEIIGEAASRVSSESRKLRPDIPWRPIIGTRNVLTHGYAQVDLDVLWTILEVDLPKLVDQLQREL